MTTYYLEKIIQNEPFFRDIGKYCNKETIESSPLEISQYIHSNIHGRHRRSTINEIIEYKKIIYSLKIHYGNGNDIFTSDNVYNSGLPGLSKFNVTYRSYLLKKILFGSLRFIFDNYMYYYCGYDLYYDNLTHYKYYSKITNYDKPIYMFFHGLGFGLMQYINLIKHFDGENLIFVDIPNLSWRRDFDYIDDRIIDITFENYIRQNKIKKINLIGHSYGGIIIQKILNNYNEYIDKVYFLESPVFSTIAGNITQKILYKHNMPYMYKILLCNDLNIEQQISRTDTMINQFINPTYYDKYVCFFAKHDELIDYHTVMSDDQINHVEHYSYNGKHGSVVFKKKVLDYVKNIIFQNKNTI